MSTEAPANLDEKTEHGRDKHRKTVVPMQRVKLADTGTDGRRRFEGYAAVFGNRDSCGDIIVKGAFANTLQENPDVKVLWQHDTDHPIGLMEAGVEDSHGLAVRAVMSDIPLVKDTITPLLTDGVVNGLSIGYSVEQEEYVADLNAWLLKEIDLYEFSLVTFPANEIATVTAVKSLDGDMRADMHRSNVARYSKSLAHELTGYFGKSDRAECLELDPLRDLHDLIGGLLPAGTLNEDSTEHVELMREKAFLEGAHFAVDLLTETQE